MSGILQREIKELETKVKQVLSRSPRYDHDHEADYNYIVQKLMFLKVLLSTESASSGMRKNTNTCLLKHIGDRLSMLENEFNDWIQFKTSSTITKEENCNEMAFSSSKRLCEIEVGYDEEEPPNVTENLQEEEEILTVCSDCEDSGFVDGDNDEDNKGETLFETGSSDTVKHQLVDDDHDVVYAPTIDEDDEEEGKENSPLSLAAPEFDKEWDLKRQEEKYFVGAVRFCGGMATGFVIGVAFMCLVMVGVCDCMFDGDNSICLKPT